MKKSFLICLLIVFFGLPGELSARQLPRRTTNQPSQRLLPRPPNAPSHTTQIYRFPLPPEQRTIERLQNEKFLNTLHINLPNAPYGTDGRHSRYYNPDYGRHLELYVSLLASQFEEHQDLLKRLETEVLPEEELRKHPNLFYLNWLIRDWDRYGFRYAKPEDDHQRFHEVLLMDRTEGFGAALESRMFDEYFAQALNNQVFRMHEINREMTWTLKSFLRWLPGVDYDKAEHATRVLRERAEKFGQPFRRAVTPDYAALWWAVYMDTPEPEESVNETLFEMPSTTGGEWNPAPAEQRRGLILTNSESREVQERQLRDFIEGSEAPQDSPAASPLSENDFYASSGDEGGGAGENASESESEEELERIVAGWLKNNPYSRQERPNDEAMLMELEQEGIEAVRVEHLETTGMGKVYVVHMSNGKKAVLKVFNYDDAMWHHEGTFRAMAHINEALGLAGLRGIRIFQLLPNVGTQGAVLREYIDSHVLKEILMNEDIPGRVRTALLRLFILRIARLRKGLPTLDFLSGCELTHFYEDSIDDVDPEDNPIMKYPGIDETFWLIGTHYFTDQYLGVEGSFTFSPHNISVHLEDGRVVYVLFDEE